MVNSRITFWRGLLADYDYNIQTASGEHKDGVYFCTDTHTILVNGIKFGGEGPAGTVTDVTEKKGTITITFGDGHTSSITMTVVSSSNNGLMTPTLLDELTKLWSNTNGTSKIYVPYSEKGAENGVAELDEAGKVPASQLPSYVDDVLEFDNKAAFPTTGESGKIYIAKDTELTYRWSGTMYVEISQSLALGETSTTAYAGDKGATNRTNLSTLSAAVSGTAGTYTYAARTSSNYLNGVNNAYAADTALDVAIANVSSGSSTADTASKTRDNAIATALKAGTSFSGNAYTYNPNTTANYISAASSFNNADVKLDAAIKSVATLIDNIGWNEAA